MDKQNHETIDKRKEIIKIYQNNELSNQEKQYRINLIMNPQFDNIHNKNTQETDNNLSNQNNIDIINCEHYNRQCMILSPCCDKWYSCRLCHDQDNDHKLDRKKIETIICKKCKTIQSPSNICSNQDCLIEFAEYYCDICKLWKDKNTPTYHCHDCGICRIGKGIDIDRIHCHKCNMCINKDLYENHKCFSGTFDSNCPVCQKYMWDSTESIIYMNCGHGIHSECYTNLMKSSFQCPVCKKSIHSDMSPIWNQVTEYLENTQMPEEFESWKTNIICNDCEEKSITEYHFMYHRCQNEKCKGYNTSIIDIMK